MKWFKAEYCYRGRDKGNWGHTVRLNEDPERKLSNLRGVVIDLHEEEEVIGWTNENSGARRISYDTWQFKSKQEAEQFIMLYNIRWP